jgi:hypothetical protein
MLGRRIIAWLGDLCLPHAFERGSCIQHRLRRIHMLRHSYPGVQRRRDIHRSAVV